MRKEKVWLRLFFLSLFFFLVEEISKCFCSCFPLMGGHSWHRSWFSPQSQGEAEWSNIWHFAVSVSGCQEASWRQIGLEQCSHPCQRKRMWLHCLYLQHAYPTTWPGAWQPLDHVNVMRTGVPVHPHFPVLASRMWGRNRAWDLGIKVSEGLYMYMYVCVKMCLWYVSRCMMCVRVHVALCVKASLIWCLQ